MEEFRENPMLTTASISIPQRSSGLHQSSRIMADFSEFGLDALDASSLSPNFLQEVSLGSIPIFVHGQINSDQLNLNTNTNSNSNDNNITQQLYDIQNALISTTSTATTTGNGTTHSNTMWSDIGNAMITTKSEPFQMDDDYIFQIDKADLIEGPTLAELNDEALLEDLNIEDLIPTEHDSYLISPHVHSHQFQNSLIPSMSSSHQMHHQSHHNQHHNQNQQQEQHQQQQQQQHQQQQQQQQQQHNSSQSPHVQQHQNLGLHLQNLNTKTDYFYDENNTTGSSSPYDIYQTTPTKSLNSSAAFSPGSHTSSNSPLLISLTPPINHSRNQFQQNTISHPGKTRSPALHELLKKEYSMSPDRNVLGQSVPGHMLISGNALSPTTSSGFGSTGRKMVGLSSGTVMSRLSSSAPTHLGMDQIWQRREPRQHLLSTGSLVEAESFSSISTASVLSPEANDFSHDEGYSDYDSDRYEDCSSDNDSDDESAKTPGNHSNSKGKERYFWQYNVQAKGPKGQRLVIKTQLEDPHVLNEVTDPVFSPNCSVRGIKHSGKARKGDGNDLTPNPRKLHIIGKELDKLGRTINDMTPVSELPFNVRPKSRKEKNKLASRACRLKKKAQHEANKIKLYGLEIEHKKLLNGIHDMKRILAAKYQNQNDNNTEDINQQIDSIVKTSTKVKIAGSSTEFVNKVLEKVKSGVSSGGLEELKNI